MDKHDVNSARFVAAHKAGGTLKDPVFAVIYKAFKSTQEEVLAASLAVATIKHEAVSAPPPAIPTINEAVASSLHRKPGGIHLQPSPLIMAVALPDPPATREDVLRPPCLAPARERETTSTLPPPELPDGLAPSSTESGPSTSTEDVLCRALPPEGSVAATNTPVAPVGCPSAAMPEEPSPMVDTTTLAAVESVPKAHPGGTVLLPSGNTNFWGGYKYNYMSAMVIFRQWLRGVVWRRHCEVDRLRQRVARLRWRRAADMLQRWLTEDHLRRARAGAATKLQGCLVWWTRVRRLWCPFWQMLAQAQTEASCLLTTACHPPSATQPTAPTPAAAVSKQGGVPAVEGTRSYREAILSGGASAYPHPGPPPHRQHRCHQRQRHRQRSRRPPDHRQPEPAGEIIPPSEPTNGMEVEVARATAVRKHGQEPAPVTALSKQGVGALPKPAHPNHLAVLERHRQ